MKNPPTTAEPLELQARALRALLRATLATVRATDRALFAEMLKGLRQGAVPDRARGVQGPLALETVLQLRSTLQSLGETFPQG